MPDLPEMKKEPELESANRKASQSNKADDAHARMNLIYPIIAGAVGGFLINLFIDTLAFWTGNLHNFDPVESLFLDAAIFRAFFDSASIFVFVLSRALIGGVFGYFAYLMPRRKKLSTVIFGAFLAGSIGGAIMFSCVAILSVS